MFVWCLCLVVFLAYVQGRAIPELPKAPTSPRATIFHNPHVNASGLMITLTRRSGDNPHPIIKQRIDELLASGNSGIDDVGVVTLLQNVKSMQYVGQLYFGEDQKHFDCIYDTGSSNTWAYTTKCQTQACKRHSRLNTDNIQNRNKMISIQYGSGSIEGLLLQGPISFEYCPQHCTASPACHCAVGGDWIGVTKTDGEAFEYGEFNCILGLAHPKLSIENTRMTVQSIASQGRIANKMFGFFLTKKEDSSGSRFTIGPPNPSLFQGDIVYHSLFHPEDSKPSYWTVKLIDIVIKHSDNRIESIGQCSQDAPCQLALDTGTSLITGPSNPVMNLINKIDVEEDCHNFDRLPRLGFVLDNPPMTYWMNPSTYVYRDKSDGADVCVGAFYPLDVPHKQRLWIAGDTFLSSYYSVYDFSCWDSPAHDCRVGLAAKSQNILASHVSSPGFSTFSHDATDSHPKAQTLSHEVGLANEPHYLGSGETMN